MSEKYLAQPDLDFIHEVVGLGGDTLKKCFQCATCSVACPIAPENSPFPRKEMIAASWGLKDKLIGNADIWLCHECGDCTTLCPRGAAPGDVMGAVRSIAISEYSQPKALGKMVNDQSQLTKLIAIPAVWLALMAFITVFMGGMMDSIFGFFGVHWYHGDHGDAIAHANFISTWLVDFTFVPLMTAVTVVFALGLKRFVTDIHENAVLNGKTDKKDLDLMELVKATIRVIPTILLHKKFSECGENQSRATSHMMLLYGFVGCAVVTGIFFVVLYIFGIPGPYSQLNPVKWIANISGIMIILGAALLIKDRMAKKSETSTYKDWFLLALVLGLGVTGMLSEMTRLAGAKYLTYLVYYIHLIFVFCLFAFLPFSKMAHLVYRTVALGYAEYANRK